MNGKPRVLIIGVGSIGERHLRCFTATQRAELAFCEVNPTLRQTIAGRFPAASVFADSESARAFQPDIVVIATPAHLHIPIATNFVRAGAHVLIEKPLSTTMNGISELADFVDQSAVTAGVAYVMRSHPALAAMRNAIQSGRFGRPVQIVAKCGQNFPFYRPAYRDIYYKDRATGGGAVQDAITHIMNAAEWLVGPIDRLVADIDHKVLEGVSVEDTVHVLTRHASVMGCFSLNQYQAPNESFLTVNCERGTTCFEFHNNRWRWQTEPGTTWTDEACQILDRDTLFIQQANDFLDAVENRTPPNCTLADGRQTLLVNLAILESAERSTWKSIGPNPPETTQ